jgi:hypothetical protein
MPEDESGLREKCEKTPGFIIWAKPDPKEENCALPLIPNPRNAKERKEAKVRQAFGPALFDAPTIVA